MPLKPTGEQVKRIAQSDIEGPVVMLNLLRYEKTAKDENGAEGLSGRGSYERYGEEMREIMEKTGAKVVWRGRADSVVIGNDDADAWDMVLLVEYPSRKAFLQMTSSSEYEGVSKHRTSALADSRLIAMTEQFRAGK